MGVLHRDIKPDNFLLSEIGAASTVKLADFGLSTFFRRGELEKEAVGSPFYMAPEMIVRGSPGYGPEADIWSCGVCLYKFLSGGHLPFPGETTADVFHAIRYSGVDYATSAWRGVSSAARDLLRRILEKDPAKRITAEGILTSPWMTRFAAGSSSGRLVCPEDSALSHQAVAPSCSPCAADAVPAPDSVVSAQRRLPSSGLDLDSGPSARSGLGAESLGAAGLPPSAAGRQCGNRVFEPVPSARIFFLPACEDTRPRLQGFIDAFKSALEAPYQRLLQASNADAVSKQWGALCLGLREMDAYITTHASKEGPFFLGREPSLVEATTAPALFRMVAALKGVRQIELLPTCDEMGLVRLAAWLREVLLRPTEVCDVAALPDHVYVSLARKLHVTYEGPPPDSPTTHSPRSSYEGRPPSPASLSHCSSLDSARASCRGSSLLRVEPISVDCRPRGASSDL